MAAGCVQCQEELRRCMTSSSCPQNDVTVDSGERIVGHGAECLDSPLIVAARRGWTAALEQLLRRGHDVDRTNEEERSALHYAAKTGNKYGVRFLLHYGACVDMKDSYGFTPLMLSCRQGHDNVVHVLIHAGCDVNATNDLGETALFYAAKDRSFRSTDFCAKFLLANGADVDVTNNNGCTALHMAVVFKKTNIVKMLLKRGCRTDLSGSLSFVSNFQSVEATVTPLEVALMTSNFHLCEMLIEFGGCEPSVLISRLPSYPATPSWLSQAARNPLMLRNLCRARIRQYCGVEPGKVIEKLPLPPQIQDYLTLEDMADF